MVIRVLKARQRFKNDSVNGHWLLGASAYPFASQSFPNACNPLLITLIFTEQYITESMELQIMDGHYSQY